MVAIFVHHYEMYVGVWPSVRQFQLFHVLRSSKKSVSPISGYCFQHRTKSLAVYIATLTPGKWDSWRDDLVIMQAEVYDWLVLPTAVPMGHRIGW
jgi:hypothetical protein